MVDLNQGADSDEANEAAFFEFLVQESASELEGHWIAWNFEVLRASKSLDEVLDFYADDIQRGNAPLFAYVSLIERA